MVQYLLHFSAIVKKLRTHIQTFIALLCPCVMIVTVTDITHMTSYILVVQVVIATAFAFSSQLDLFQMCSAYVFRYFSVTFKLYFS